MVSMKTAPLFSVIMPVYNKEPYIRDTIASVLAQTCTSFEVVDDRRRVNGQEGRNLPGVCFGRSGGGSGLWYSQDMAWQMQGMRHSCSPREVRGVFRC